MKFTFVRKTYKEYRPRLPGVLLVSLIHCVPIYAITWYFSLIDDLSATHLDKPACHHVAGGRASV